MQKGGSAWGGGGGVRWRVGGGATCGGRDMIPDDRGREVGIANGESKDHEPNMLEEIGGWYEIPGPI